MADVMAPRSASGLLIECPIAKLAATSQPSELVLKLPISCSRAENVRLTPVFRTRTQPSAVLVLDQRVSSTSTLCIEYEYD
jgi:hypothetical protein